MVVTALAIVLANILTARRGRNERGLKVGGEAGSKLKRFGLTEGYGGPDRALARRAPWGGSEGRPERRPRGVCASAHPFSKKPEKARVIGGESR